MIFKPIINPYILLVIIILSLGFVGFTIIRSRGQRRKQWILRSVMVVLLIVMAFRPSITGGSANLGLSNFDVIFAIDTTNSMVAEDYDGNKPRLEGVKKDIQNLTKNLAGARFSVMTFDNNASVILPLTTDATATVTAANTVSQEISYYSLGSAIDKPVELLKKTLSEYQKSKPDRTRLLFYFGDGEQTIEAKPKSFSELNSLLDGGVVLGYGTEAGGRMKEFTGSDTFKNDEYITDYSSKDFTRKDALSKIDETNLKTIAKEIGGFYENRTKPTDTANIVKKLSVEKLEKTTVDVNATTDLYWLLGIPFVLLLLIDIRKIVEMLLEIKESNT